MANIPLKTIKFPGLDDTYTVPQVDDDLDTAGAAADAKATGDALTEINERLDSLIGVPNTVRQAILALFNSGVYVATGLTDEISIIEEWASVHTTAIVLSENSISFTEAGVHQLSAILTPSDTTDTPTWVSSDETVAVVSQSGLVTTVGNGLCVISAVIGTLVANCEVSVSGMIIMHTITNSLTKVDNSNSAIVIGDGEDYSAELTANAGYELLAGNVSITMNGLDITSTAYLNGLITINNVDGPIVIAASATLKGTNLMKPVNSTNWAISTHLTISDVDGNDYTGTVKDSYGLSWNAVLLPKGLTEKSDTLSGKTVYIEYDVEISGNTSSSDTFNIGLTAWDRANPTSGTQRKGINGATLGCHESGHYSREFSVSETDMELSSSYYIGLFSYFYGPQGFKVKVSNAVVTYY